MKSVMTETLGMLGRGSVLAVATVLLAACSTSGTPTSGAQTSGDGVGPVQGASAAGSDAGSSPQLASSLKTAPDIDDPDAGADGLVSDPLEDWNRFVFDLNTLIYTLLQPVIAPYGVLPAERKHNVDNFVHNLSTPVILVNDLLQGDADRAWVTTQRFVINTAGGLGFFDPATDMGLPKHSEDFGQTLGVWGVGDGPYMVYPIIGPSNPRDGMGRLVDMATDPLFWLSGSTVDALAYSKTYISSSSQIGSGVNQMEQLRGNSLDFYAAVRSLYTQSRRAAVHNHEDGPAVGAGSVAPAGAAFDPDAYDDIDDSHGEVSDSSVGAVRDTAERGATPSGASDGTETNVGPDALRIQVRGGTQAVQ